MKRLYIFVFAFLLSSVLYSQELVILHLNDTHSHIEPEKTGRYAGMGGVFEQALYIDEVRAEEGRGNVLLLHAGDFSQGTSYFTELGGDIEIDILNSMRFDAVCLGNHEFDNGFDELARRLRNLDVPVVCANYDFSGTVLEKLVEPYIIVRKAGMKIGIIGLLTDVSAVVNADIAALLNYRNPVVTADRYASYLKNEKKCDLVICLTHLGFEDEPMTDVELAASTKNVDIIVGGHSHTRLESEQYVRNLSGREVVIVTDWKWGLEVGRLDLTR